MRTAFFCLLPLVLFACAEDKKFKAPETMISPAADSAKAAPPVPVELADARYTELGRERALLFAAGEYDKWGEGLAENAILYWSAGDSLVGKKAIVDYWKQRREKDFDTVQPTRHIWLPVKVNLPQQGPDLPGVWLMGWNQMNVKFKNGKPLQFWMHNSLHYNAQDKVDRMIVYMDRAPINEALEAIKKAEAARRRTAPRPATTDFE